MPEYSQLLDEAPSFLSLVSMVTDDRETIIKDLVHAERKSPSYYEPAIRLFVRALQGDFSFEQTVQQAQKLVDQTERKCALDVLNASERYLRSQSAARMGQISPMTLTLPDGLPFTVSPVWIRHLEPERLMVLHVWRQPLSELQLGAAASILRTALVKWQPMHARCELDFISVTVPTYASTRKFLRYSWETARPLDDEELYLFLRRFCDAWSEYQRRGPREVKRRRQSRLLL